MKRAIIIIILLLCMMTSLTAGTLAVYTSKVELLPSKVVAKQFYVGIGGGNDEFNIRLEPGETIFYTFEVTNQNREGAVAEVDIDLSITGAFVNMSDGLDIRLYENGVQLADVKTDGSLYWSQPAAFKANTAATREYELAFTLYDPDPAGMPDVKIHLYVNGTQSTTAAQ